MELRRLLRPRDPGHGVFGQFRPYPAGASREKGKRCRCALDQWLAVILSVEGIPIPYGAPNASAHVERFMRTLREECLQHFLSFSEAQLRWTVAEFTAYCNEARVHQGIADIPHVVAGRQRARRPPTVGSGRLLALPVLGGLAHDYQIAA